MQGRARSPSAEPSIPSALEETIISSYKARRRSLPAGAGATMPLDSSPVLSTASTGSLRTAMSYSRSRSRSRTLDMASSHRDLRDQQQQQQQQPTRVTLSPPTPTVSRLSSSSSSRSPSPAPAPVGRRSARSEGSTAEYEEDTVARGAATTTAAAPADAKALLATLRSRADSVEQRQRQHRRELEERQVRPPDGPEDAQGTIRKRSVSGEGFSASRSASSSLSRPLQQLLRHSQPSQSSTRKEEGRRKAEGREEGTAAVARDSLSPLTVSEASDEDPRQLRAVALPVPSRDTLQSPTRSHEGGGLDRGRENPFAWQQHLVDEQLRRREARERQQQAQPREHEAMRRTAAAEKDEPIGHTDRNASDPPGLQGDVEHQQMDLSSVVHARQASRLHQLVDEEWARRTQQFQGAKRELEAELMDHFAALRQREHERALSRSPVESAGNAGSTEKKDWQTFLKTHFSAAYEDLLAREAAFQDELERRVVEQVAIFTEEYKKALDADFEERCRRMDSRVAERDRKWVSILAEERRRLQTEENAGGEARQQDIILGAVGEAMQEVNTLREQLTRDYEKQQAKLMQVFMEKRDALNAAHAEALRKQASQVDSIQRDCTASLLACQAEIDELNALLAAKEVEIHRLEQQQQQHGSQGGAEQEGSAFAERCARIREEVSAHWQGLLEEQRQEHKTMLRALTEEYDTRVETLRSEQQKRLAELAASSQHHISEAHRMAEEQWAATLEDHKQGAFAREEKRKACEAANQELRRDIRTLHRELEALREAKAEQIAQAQAQTEAEWRGKLQQTQARYEQLLTTATQRQHTSVPQEEHSRLVHELQAAKLKLVEMTATIAASTNDAVDKVEEEWRRRLENQAEEHRGVVATLRSQYEEKLSTWRETLSKKEAEWHAQTQESIGRLQRHMQQQLEQERASCEAIVAAAHASASQRLEAFVAERERGWEQKRTALEASLQQREAQLALREAQLRQRDGEREAELRVALAREMAEERRQLFLSLEKDQAELAVAKEGLAEQKRQQQFALQRAYEKKFFDAKQQLRGQQAAMCAEIFALAEARERVLLSAREEDLSLLTGYYSASLRQLATQQYELRDTIQEEMANQFDRAATILEVQKSALVGQMTELQKQIALDSEAACRDMLDAHQAALMERYEAQADDGNARWQHLQEYVLQRTRQVDEQQRAFEANLRSHYEALLREERTKVTDAMEDLRRSQAQSLESVRAACEEDAEKKLATLSQQREADQQRWQSRVDALTARLEAARREQRERRELGNREQQEKLEEQRATLEAEHQARMEALEATLNEQSKQVRAACEARVRQATDKERALRAQLACDLVAVEKRHLARNEALQEELHRHFEEQLATLRSELQARSESLAATEMAQEAAVAARVEAALAEMQRRYDAFVEQQQTKAHEAAAAHAEALSRAQEEHERAVAALQRQEEDKLNRFMASMEAKAKTDAEERLADFHRQADELQRLFEAEKEAKAVLQRELEQLRQATLAKDTHCMPRHPSTAAASPSWVPSSSATRPVPAPSLSAPSPPLLLPSNSSHGNASSHPSTPYTGTQYITVSNPAAVTARRQQRPVSPASNGGFLASRSVNTLPPPPSTKEPAAATALEKKANTPRGDVPANLSGYLARAPAWHRLTELWSVLETTAEERAHFKERLMVSWSQQQQQQQHESGTGRLVQEVLVREVSRLEAQLPLLEAFARRQYLLSQRSAADSNDNKENQPTNGSGLPSSPMASEEEEEVARLTEQLTSAIPQHEKLFGQTFVFRGERLMEQLC